MGSIRQVTDDNLQRSLHVRNGNHEHEYKVLDNENGRQDLNLIEHEWDILGRRANDGNERPQNFQHREQLLSQEYQNTPQQQLDGLIWPMPRRVNPFPN